MEAFNVTMATLQMVTGALIYALSNLASFAKEVIVSTLTNVLKCAASELT
jgi:hypothetical protein